MLLTLIRKEIVSHILSLRFGVTFILFILLVFASIYVTSNEYRRDADEARARNRAAAAALDRMMDQEQLRDRFFDIFYNRGRHDAVPPPALSSIVQGLRPAMPAAVNARRYASRKIGRTMERNPLAGLLPIPDLVYVVGVVLSLLSILFAFDSVCGEKESGTLRLMMSNPVPRDQVLLAKWIGGYLSLIVPFLIAVAGGLGYAWWTGALALTDENITRLGMLLLVACMYISVFFTLSVAISALTHRAPTALFICLFVWVVWILVIPNLAPVVAKIVEPGHSARKIAEEKDAVRREIGLLQERLTLTTGKLSYGKDIEREREKLDRERDRRINQWDRFLASSLKRQTLLAATLGRISPSACWTYSAVALTDTGPAAYKSLDKAVEELQNEMSRAADSIRTPHSREDPKEFTLQQVPSLRIRPPGLGEALKSTINDILILSILNVVFFMTAFVCFLRYDVR